MVTHQPGRKCREIRRRRESSNAFWSSFEVEDGGPRNAENNFVFFEIFYCDWREGV